MGYKFNPFVGGLDTVDSPNGVFEAVEINGDITLDDGGTYTTTLQTITPTANRTVSLPNATGTVALVAGSSGQVVWNNAGANAGASTLTYDGSILTTSGRFINSYNATASAPAKVFTGTWFTGGTSTTTKPQVLIEPAGTTSTSWSTSGTGLGVNAATGFTGRLLDLQTNGTSRAIVTGAGQLLVGTNASNSRFYNGTSIEHYFQQEVATTSLPYMASWLVNSGAGGSGIGPHLSLARSRGTSNGTYTIVQSGDSLGHLSFQGADGGELVEAARIEAAVDGTPGSNDMPGRLVFYTVADGSASLTERMRIDNTGACLINTTANVAFFDGRLRVDSATSVASFKTTGAAGVILQSLWHEATSGDNQFVSFGTEVTRLTRGTITYNRAGGLVAYNTTSDYRAKTILGNIDNSGETIDALKVYRGVMNGATVERPMLVAHEAQEVAPYCVTGEKDAVDNEGNPIYQQMDHQALVPLLIAEIQQLRARVAALEAS